MHTVQRLSLCLLIVATAAACASAGNSLPDGPSVVLDKSSGPFGQDYRLEVFPDGRALYTGRYRVKTKGQHWLSVDSNRLDHLLRELEDEGVARYEPKRGHSVAQSRVDFSLAVHGKGLDRVVELNSDANLQFAIRVEEAIERHIPTKHLRCPYKVRLGGLEEELCARHEQAVPKLGARGEK